MIARYYDFKDARSAGIFSRTRTSSSIRRCLGPNVKKRERRGNAFQMPLHVIQFAEMCARATIEPQTTRQLRHSHRCTHHGAPRLLEAVSAALESVIAVGDLGRFRLARGKGCAAVSAAAADAAAAASGSGKGKDAKAGALSVG